MVITMTNTDQIVDIVTAQGTVQARVWTGTTYGGIEVQCLVTRIAVKRDADHSAFERELTECPPVPAVTPAAFPTALRSRLRLSR